VLSLTRTLVDSICEFEYCSGRISEVGFLIAFAERSDILKASGIHPTMMQVPSIYSLENMIILERYSPSLTKSLTEQTTFCTMMYRMI